MLQPLRLHQLFRCGFIDLFNRSSIHLQDVYKRQLQIFGTGLTPLLRNSRKTIAAMVIMVTGLLTNILLDWYFIMPLQMGMAGAALALSLIHI